jgi:alanine dehydrogenase
MSTLILSRADVRGLLDMSAVIESVEKAFREMERGEAQMPPKSYLVLEKGDFRAMPAALPGAVGIKWVNVHPGNPARGLPTVMGILIFSDPGTGYPMAVMDATEFTAYRTGATAAIASKHMARPDSHTLGLIGAGRQSYAQVMAHALLFKLKQINVFDQWPHAAEKMVRSFPKLPIRVATAQEAAASDILCTITPSRTPVVKKRWINPGTHINAVGADAAGKEELEPSILKAAVVVVDDMEQATMGGEINVPVKAGLFKSEDVYATLGEVISGKKKGRRSSEEITIFDSTGVAIEDIAVARLIYQKACVSGDYHSTNFVEG